MDTSIVTDINAAQTRDAHAAVAPKSGDARLFDLLLAVAESGPAAPDQESVPNMATDARQELAVDSDLEGDPDAPAESIRETDDAEVQPDEAAEPPVIPTAGSAPAGSRPISMLSAPASEPRGEGTASRADFGSAKTFPKASDANAEAVLGGPDSERSRPAIVASGENPFMRAGGGQAIADLNLQAFDVRRFEVRIESPAEPVDTPVQSVEPEGGVDPGPDEAVEARLAQQPEPTAVFEGPVEKGARPHRDFRPAAVGGATHAKTPTGSVPDDAVQWSSEVPREMNDPDRGADPRMLPARPQPAKPVVPQTFSLEPARRVTMLLGEAGNEVQVHVRESQGEVSVRFNAAHAVRGGLEASVGNLVESLTREQVPVTDVSFSGPAHSDTGSGQSRQQDASGSSHHRAPIVELTEESLFTPEFETASGGLGISLTA